MAQSKRPGFPNFFTDPQSADSARRQFLEAPLDAAGPSALAAGLELAEVLSILPDAFVESQKRELKRLQATSSPNDERISFLQSSIEEGEVLRTLVHRGEARVQRNLGAATANEDVFHGFVSDPTMVPVAGVTVRLKGDKSQRGKASATTDADGYFSISLGTRKRGDAKSLRFSERVNKMFEGRDLQSTIAAPQKKESVTASVEIVRKNQVIHEDPVPVKLDEGTVYREYVVSEDSSTAKTADEFVSKLSADQTADNTEKK